METNTLKKQAAKADMEYRKAISKLTTESISAREKQHLELLTNYYYPRVADSLRLYISEAFSFFVSKLDANSILDYLAIKEYLEIKRSSDLLQNLSLVTDKKALLKQAFLYCPYNSRVYEEVLNNNLADYHTFMTAKYFMQDKLLLEPLEVYLLNNRENIELIQVPLKILSLYQNKSEDYILRKIFEDKFQLFTEWYKTLNNICCNDKDLLKWIEEYITTDAEELSGMNEVIISDRIEKVLSNKIVSENEFNIFRKLNLLENIFCVSVENSLEKINLQYINLISCNISKIQNTIIQNIGKYKEYIENLKLELKATHSSFDEKEALLLSEEKELRMKSKNTNFFSFSKKKEINSKLTECIQQIKDIKYEKKAAIDELEIKLKKVNQELHSISTVYFSCL